MDEPAAWEEAEMDGKRQQQCDCSGSPNERMSASKILMLVRQDKTYLDRGGVCQ